MSPHPPQFALRSLILLSLAAAGWIPAADAIEPTPAELAEMRAQAEEWFEGASRAVPPSLRPGDSARGAFVDAYVATMTRETTPCAELDAGSPDHPHSPLEQWRRVRSGSAGPQARSAGGEDTVQCWGRVYLDVDEDGELDFGEPGLQDIAVSNGRQSTILGLGVQLTLTDGSFTFITPLADSRFIFVTVPSGYTLTTPFFHRLSAIANPDTAYFGLRPTPETANPIFRWVHISDTHMFDDPQTGVDLSNDLTEIEALPVPPAFVVVTGDLTNTGTHNEQFQNYLDGISGHATPVHSGYGDHDASDTNPLVTGFEDHLGPTSYSFEYGGVHFIMYNDIHPVSESGIMTQSGWLALDMFVARARDPNHSIPIVICKHTMPLAEEINLYNLLTGIVGTFSGHWHGSRVRLVEGIFDIHVPPSRFAGIDKSSRGFRVNDMTNGEIATEYRLAGIADLSTITQPADEDTVVAGLIPIRVNSYDSKIKMISGSFSADGPISTGALPLAADGPWAWKGTWNAATAPDGVYTITTTITPETGAPHVRTSTVTLVRASVPMPDPYTDWPCYKHDPQGTSFTANDLLPPFRLAWVKHLGGRNNVESPVVAGGKVYVGTSNISTVNEAALNCFDAVTGDLLWRFPARTDVKSTPAVADGRVFFSNSIGTLFALNAASGQLLWTAQLGDSLTRWEMTSPTVVGDTVYAGGIPAMSALRASTGQLLWQQVGEIGPSADFVPSIYSAPAVSGDVVVFTNKGGIFAFNRHTGSPMWQFTGNSQHHRSPAIMGNEVYTLGGAFGNHRLKAYDLMTGATTYLADFRQSESTAGPAVTATRIIAVHGSNPPGGVAHSLMQGWGTTLGGNYLWEFQVDPAIACSRPYERYAGSVNSTPAVANQVVYFGADDGRLYALNVANGAELWRHDFGVPVRSSPAIAGNMLFLTTEDGSLYALVSGYVSTTGTGPIASSPRPTRLLGPRPNPFRPGGSLAFELAGAVEAPQPVALRIYDPAGRLVRRVLDEKLAPGLHAPTWDARGDDGRSVASGVYFVTLEVGGRTFQDRLVLVR